jgi:saccharopepsin
MILSTLAPLLLLPFVAGDGVHRMKLKKVPLTASNPSLEAAYLAEKYSGLGRSQTPLMGSGGSGRNVRLGRPSQKNDGLFWTQEQVMGGHSAPLSSA